MNNGNVAESIRVTAHHEAAHAAAAYVLGRRTELVSIRAGQEFSGVHMTKPVDLSDLELAYVPALLQVPAVWRSSMVSVAIALAGPLGSELAGYRPVGWVAPTHDELRAEAQAQAIAGLAVPEVDQLVSAERDTEPFLSDEESAAKTSAAAMGNAAVASAFLGLMRALTREIAFAEPFIALVDVLAAELLANKVVPGHRVTELFDAENIWRKAEPMPLTPEERLAELAAMKIEDDLRWLKLNGAIDEAEYQRRRAEHELGGGEAR